MVKTFNQRDVRIAKLEAHIRAIQDALGTAETGDNLVSVARAAHQAELVMSKISNIVDEYAHADDWANLPDKDFHPDE
jgi:hypothetical protein